MSVKPNLRSILFLTLLFAIIACSSKEEIVVIEEPVLEKSQQSLTVVAGVSSFKPRVLFANPGDEICWTNMMTHDSQSMEGLIPAGAEPWQIPLDSDGCVTLTVEGVYIYKCNPHYALGMAGAIIVGEAGNMEQIESNVSGRAKGVVSKVKRALEK